MSVAEICSTAKFDIESLDRNQGTLISEAYANVEAAQQNRNLWNKFWHWVFGAVQQILEFIEWLKQRILEIIENLLLDILFWVSSPAILKAASEVYHQIAARLARLTGQMAKGQIQPAAGWAGVGADAYEATRGQQQEAAGASSSLAQGLSESMSRVADRMIANAVKIAAIVVKLQADLFKEVGNLLDIKKWTEVIPASGACISAFEKAVVDIVVQLVEYVQSATSEVNSLRRETLKVGALAGGAGWPAPVGSMTQPDVAGEAPTWDDKDSGPNIPGV